MDIQNPLENPIQDPALLPPSHHPNNKFKPNPKSNPNRFNRKPRKNQRFTPYEQKPIEKGLLSVPREPAFEVFTSNLGIQSLTHVVYSAILAKDHRLGNNISQLQLEYVTNIVFLHRLVQVSIHFGKTFYTHSSVLKQVAENILLPSILCDYIETLGSFKLPSGATIIPLMRDWNQLFGPIGMGGPIFGLHPDQYLDPRTTLMNAERVIPPGDWALDHQWIQAYNLATSRASRSGIGFRTVNPGFEGKFPLVAGYQGEFNGFQHALGPIEGLEPELQIGACYGFRDHENREGWFHVGNNYNHLVYGVFETNVFRGRDLFTSKVLSAFAGPNRQ